MNRKMIFIPLIFILIIVFSYLFLPVNIQRVFNILIPISILILILLSLSFSLLYYLIKSLK
ncbi:hypothetical protein FM106_01185 [Brachybacterium faecium]|nr:hypothetical protein FM106_01185 [Brachybacterium faecium]